MIGMMPFFMPSGGPVWEVLYANQTGTSWPADIQDNDVALTLTGTGNGGYRDPAGSTRIDGMATSWTVSYGKTFDNYYSNISAAYNILSASMAGTALGNTGGVVSRQWFIFRRTKSPATAAVVNIGASSSGGSFNQTVPFGVEEPPLFPAIVTLRKRAGNTITSWNTTFNNAVPHTEWGVDGGHSATRVQCSFILDPAAQDHLITVPDVPDDATRHQPFNIRTT